MDLFKTKRKTAEQLVIEQLKNIQLKKEDLEREEKALKVAQEILTAPQEPRPKRE